MTAGVTAAVPIGLVERFWTARDAELRLDAGHLSDPEGPYAAWLGDADRVVTLRTLDDTPCIVMLGAPSSGKTTAVALEVERLTAAAAVAGTADRILHFDLRDLSELAELCAAVFGHPELVRWQSGTHRLTLVLDSLDEALIEMRKLATRLATELRALPVERLRVRIACRTADWPSVLEHALGALWDERGLRALEIAWSPRRARPPIRSERAIFRGCVGSTSTSSWCATRKARSHRAAGRVMRGPAWRGVMRTRTSVGRSSTRRRCSSRRPKRPS